MTTFTLLCFSFDVGTVPFQLEKGGMSGRVSLRCNKAPEMQVDHFESRNSCETCCYRVMGQLRSFSVWSKFFDDSILLPGLFSGENSNDSDGSEGNDEEYHICFTEDDADGVFQDWLLSMERQGMKMMALMLHDNKLEQKIWAYQDSCSC